MSNKSSFLKITIYGTMVVTLAGCRVAKNPFASTAVAPSSNQLLASVAPDNSPSFVDYQRPSVSLASTEKAVPPSSVRQIDPELIPYLPKEDETLDAIEEYRPQTYSFDSATSSGYRSQTRSSSSGCTSGCCSQ